MPNSRQRSVMASPSRSRATKRRRSSTTEHSFQGIGTSRLSQAESVTHVSGTICHLCLGSLIPASIEPPARTGAGQVLDRPLVGLPGCLTRLAPTTARQRLLLASSQASTSGSIASVYSRLTNSIAARVSGELIVTVSPSFPTYDPP